MQSLEQKPFFDDISQGINITWGAFRAPEHLGEHDADISFFESCKLLFLGGVSTHDSMGTVCLSLTPLLGKGRKAVESHKWHSSFQSRVGPFLEAPECHGMVFSGTGEQQRNSELWNSNSFFMPEKLLLSNHEMIIPFLCFSTLSAIWENNIDSLHSY